MSSDWADATFKELVETAWTTALKWQDTYMDQTTPMGIKDQQRAALTAKRSAIIAELERRSTALRDAARVPEGYVRTADGVDRKVVGTLPITADGCVVMPGQMVYVPGYASAWTLQPELIVAVATQDADGHWRDMVVGECYTTYEACREAALAQPTPARHQWFDSGMLNGVESCRVCGVVRQRDGRNDAKPCKGAVRVGPRSCTCNRNHVDDDEHAPTCGLNSTPARGEGE